ncbi:uncharacterized protein LOC103946170 [Pyrus x bretschneideri]|uniref:uncharacterized protein LOC103946170 n=1 Tax=Pyrus x bretschneideri TaxID=225117 RepID=UPI00202EA64E|nr:uncharacterized protein LOC103946170 [Pyrus x bretschneideri]
MLFCIPILVLFFLENCFYLIVDSWVLISMVCCRLQSKRFSPQDSVYDHHEDHHTHDHVHDPGVSSVSIVCEGNLELEKANIWLGTLLLKRSEDIYRMKGLLSVQGMKKRFVFQGLGALKMPTLIFFTPSVYGNPGIPTCSGKYFI